MILFFSFFTGLTLLSSHRFTIYLSILAVSPKLSEFTLTRPQRSPSPPPASPRGLHHHLDFLLHRFLDFTFVTFSNSPILIWTSVSAHLYISYVSCSRGVDQPQKLHRSSPILLPFALFISLSDFPLRRHETIILPSSSSSSPDSALHSGTVVRALAQSLRVATGICYRTSCSHTYTQPV